MNDYPYKKKYDLTKVTPFTPSPNKNTFSEFSTLVEQGKLNEVAYWVRAKEMGSSSFKYFYEKKGERFPYKMTDMLGHALEVSLMEGHKDLIEFFLFDDVVRDRHLFQGNVIHTLQNGVDYANCYIDTKSPKVKEAFVFALSHGLKGTECSFASIPQQWLTEAFQALPYTQASLSYLTDFQQSILLLIPELEHNPQKIEQEYPEDYDLYKIIEYFLDNHSTRSLLKDETKEALTQKTTKRLSSKKM